MFIGSANRLTRTENVSPALALELRAATLDSRLTFTRASAATDIIGGVVVAFASDAPRISVANGLLMEETRTNIARYSETLDNAPWTASFARASRSTVTTLNPMGASVSVPVLIEDDQSGTHEWQPSFTVAASTTYTASVFLKPNGRNFVGLSYFASGTPNLSGTAVFDIANGTIVSAGSLNPTLIACANGWYRLSITGTTGAGATALEFKIMLYSDSTTSSYAGDSSSGVLVWGAQMEAGAFASSYIPTTSASATRGNENCTIALAGWFNEAEGTLLAVARTGITYDGSAVVNNRLLRIDNGGSNAVHELRRNNVDNGTRAGTVNNSTTQSILSLGSWGNSATVRMAYAFRHNDMAGCLNGGTVATDTTSPDGMPTGLTLMRIGSSNSSGAFGGYVWTVRYWRQRMHNDQLKAITS